VRQIVGSSLGYTIAMFASPLSTQHQGIQLNVFVYYKEHIIIINIECNLFSP
jgi:hypothetical protein